MLRLNIVQRITSQVFGVVGGMAIGTLALVFVVPAFFIVFQTLEEKLSGEPKSLESGKEETK